MKNFIFYISQKGTKVTAKVSIIKNNQVLFLGLTNWCVASYKGEQSEVMNWLKDNNYLKIRNYKKVTKLEAERAKEYYIEDIAIKQGYKIQYI